MDQSFKNPDLPLEQRVELLLNALTIEEKVSQLSHESVSIRRLDIPAHNWWNEALHGVARNGLATVFPQVIGLAATFHPELVQKIADAIATEARAKFHAIGTEQDHLQYQGLTFWAPNINIFRDPRWGRGQETFGEDPFLTGILGTSFVKGLQGDHPFYLKTAAGAKHFAVHSGPEKIRHSFDAVASQKDLYETYLPAFEKLVREGVETVMGAYNRTNGEPCCASPTLLQKILRKKWGFKGHVVSDCGAIRDIHEHHKVTEHMWQSAALALKNGCDLNCGCSFGALMVALDNNEITEEHIDTSLRRLLRTRFRLGMFDPDEKNPYAAISLDSVGCKEHRSLARQAAAEGVVLLKNSNKTLPLKKDISTLFVLGPNAASTEVLLGNYYGLSSSLTTVLEGITGAVSKTSRVAFRPGCLLDREKPNPVEWAMYEADSCDAIVAVMGLSPMLEGEEGDALCSYHIGDKPDFYLPQNQVDYLKTLREKSKKPIILLLTGGSPVMNAEVHDLCDAVAYIWYPGEAGGDGVADVLFGDVCPSGRLPFSVPESLQELPDYTDYSMKNRTYRFTEKNIFYPFGFGLSYCEFAYEKLKIENANAGSVLQGSFILKNKSEIPGTEIAQIYARFCNYPQSPLQSLCWFSRIELQPGEEKTVSFEIAPAQLKVFDEQGTASTPKGNILLTVAGAVPTGRSRALGASVPQSVSFSLS